MSAIVTLTTDFGLDDSYVAEMKGIILGINPGASLVDICHTIRPQDVRQAAFLLGNACSAFPVGTVHVAVVDPGVGTDRRAVIVRTPSALFVAPDNGTLGDLFDGEQQEPTSDDSTAPARQAPGGQHRAYAITNPDFWRSPVSPTFHGRDIFAPVAAHLSLGTPPERIGDRIMSIVTLPSERPMRAPDGSLTGQVRHIDRFGNLVTNITRRDLPATGDSVTIEIGDRAVAGLSRTYADGQGLLALIGGGNCLELAASGGSARDLLGAKIGDAVRVRRTDTGPSESADGPEGTR